MSKRVLIVASGFYPETHGVAEVAYQHALGLCTLGYHITVLTAQAQVGAAKNHFDFSPPPFPFPFDVVYIKPTKQAYQHFLQTWQGDIICLHGWHNWVSSWAIPIAKRLVPKAILVSHGTNFNIRYPNLSGLLRWLWQRPTAWRFQKKLTVFDYYVFLSALPDSQRMSDLIIANKLNISNYSIISNGAKPEFSEKSFINFKEKYCIKHSKILLCVGNYQYYKGQQDLVRWILELQLKDTALVLIGSEFNKFSAQLKRIAGTQLNQSIFMFEQLSTTDIHAAYQSADIFVSATYTEVQPLVLLDAMAVGVPFLCRNVGTVKELAGGICFEDKEDFQTKLQFLLHNPKELIKLKIEGQQAVNEQYNWEKVMQQYDELFRKLLS